MSQQPSKADVLVQNHGSIWAFVPNSDSAEEWIKENVQAEPWQYLGDALCVEWRYASQLIQGMREFGLVVEGDN